MPRKPIITIDGEAGAGKGSVGRILAARLGYAHMESGLLYRAVAAAVLGFGGNPASASDCSRAIKIADFSRMDAAALRPERIAQAASVLADQPSVRMMILGIQRDFARRPPAQFGGAILDGREAGSVAVPGADMKLYLTCALGERARRRTHQLHALGVAVSIEEVLGSLATRDARERGRAVAPIRVPDGAVTIDTTNLTAEQAADFAAAAAPELFLAERRLALIPDRVRFAEAAAEMC